jgi:hypothetical protein
MRTLTSLCLALGLMMSCLLISGCDLTLGPKVKTTYVLIQPGKPVELLESVKVKGRLLDGGVDPVTQDIGGWIAMPPEHWAAVQRALLAAEAAKK